MTPWYGLPTLKALRAGASLDDKPTLTFRLTFEPEFVTNYELGLKKTMLDGRLTFNPTVFFSDYEDKQESILIPVDLTNVATVVRNASTQEIFGVEVRDEFPDHRTVVCAG